MPQPIPLDRGPDLLKYTRLIVQAEGEYRGDPWLCYDIAFCTRATNRHFQWADIDSALWNHTFSGMSKATSYCSICLDSTHATMSECPLYHQGPATCRTTSAGSDPSGGISSLTQSNHTTCINWDRGKCRFPNCGRAHVFATQGCEEPHWFSECPKHCHSPPETPNIIQLSFYIPYFTHPLQFASPSYTLNYLPTPIDLWWST